MTKTCIFILHNLLDNQFSQLTDLEYTIMYLWREKFAFFYKFAKLFLLQIFGKLTSYQQTHGTLLRAKYLLDLFIFHTTRGRIWFVCSIIGCFNNGISNFILKSLQIKLIVTMKVVFLFKTSKRVDRFSWNVCMKIQVDPSEGLRELRLLQNKRHYSG